MATKTRTIVLISSTVAALLLAESLLSKQSGIFPNTLVAPGRGQNPINVGSLTRTAAKSCGQCHTPSTPGAVTVKVSPAARSLLVNQTTAVTVSGSSSTTSTTGGFTADVTKGTLIAGSGTKVNTVGTAITHSSKLSRSWSFNYRAPANPGLVELYAVVNTSNGTGGNTGDTWAFHGSSPTNTTSTPVRLYANAAAGVKPTGVSCPDGFGNYSVLGAPVAPTRGQTFRLEAYGMAPSAPLLIMFSIGGNVPPIDLAAAGAPGCVLRTLMQIQAVVATSGGNQTHAEGSFVLPFSIPTNVPKGLVFAAQFGYIDNASQRPFQFTVTNGLECTVQ